MASQLSSPATARPSNSPPANNHQPERTALSTSLRSNRAPRYKDRPVPVSRVCTKPSEPVTASEEAEGTVPSETAPANPSGQEYSRIATAWRCGVTHTRQGVRAAMAHRIKSMTLSHNRRKIDLHPNGPVGLPRIPL